MTEMLTSFYLHPLVLALLVGALVFVFIYLRLPGFLNFFQGKQSASQKEILEIMDKMLIKTPKEKAVFYMWAGGSALGFILFLLVWPNLILGLGLGVIALLGSWLGVQMAMRNMWERRCNKVVNQMVEGLIVMTNGVKVGLSVTQSMERAVKNVGGVFGQELRLVLNKVRLGQSVEEALSEMEARIDRQDVTMMVIAINILKETGGNIAETLGVIAETVRERQKIEKKIQALTAQGRMQAMILSCIPFVIMMVMFMSNKSYASVMLGTPLGWVCMLIITGMVILGGFFMKKVITIRV